MLTEIREIRVQKSTCTRIVGLLNTNCTNYTNMLLENGKNRKFLKIREIREISVGKFNIPHSALKDSITNLSKLAL